MNFDCTCERRIGCVGLLPMPLEHVSLGAYDLLELILLKQVFVVL